MNISAWCLKCRKTCKLTQTHMHRAGSPCVHHSTLGDRQKNEGKHHFLFWIWVALMRILKVKIIVHENVRGFGDVALRALLGDLYVVILLLSDPVTLGWPIQRNRQFVVMILKVWVFEVLPDVPQTTQDIENALDLRTTISNMFARDIAPGFTWEAFLHADADEIMAERAWARQRPGVRARWFGCPEDSSTTSPDVYRDTRECFLGHLTKEERRCYEMAQERWPLCAYNVSQNPSACCQRTLEDGTFFTMTKHCGICVLPRGERFGNDPRWVAPTELFAMMGVPTTLDAQSAAGNATCVFATTGLEGRTPHSQRSQVGNSMHVNMIGSVQAVLVLKFPGLGLAEQATVRQPQRPATLKRGPPPSVFLALARKRPRP